MATAGFYLYALVPPDTKFSKFWYEDRNLAQRFATDVINSGGKSYIKAVCGKETLGPDDLIRPCTLGLNHAGFCDTGR